MKKLVLLLLFAMVTCGANAACIVKIKSISTIPYSTSPGYWVFHTDTDTNGADIYVRLDNPLLPYIQSMVKFALANGNTMELDFGTQQPCNGNLPNSILLRDF